MPCAVGRKLDDRASIREARATKESCDEACIPVGRAAGQRVPVRAGVARDGTPYCGLVWGSLVKSDPTMSGAPVVNVRTGRHTCYDRLVVDVAGDVGGYTVSYVTEVVQDGSGEPIPTRGGAALQITVNDPAYDENGNATYSRPTASSCATFRLPHVPAGRVRGELRGVHELRPGGPGAVAVPRVRAGRSRQRVTGGRGRRAPLVTPRVPPPSSGVSVRPCRAVRCSTSSWTRWPRPRRPPRLRPHPPAPVAVGRRRRRGAGRRPGGHAGGPRLPRAGRGGAARGDPGRRARDRPGRRRPVASGPGGDRGAAPGDRRPRRRAGLSVADDGSQAFVALDQRTGEQRFSTRCSAPTRTGRGRWTGRRPAPRGGARPTRGRPGRPPAW